MFFKILATFYCIVHTESKLTYRNNQVGTFNCPGALQLPARFHTKLYRNSKQQHHAGLPETKFGARYLKTCATKYGLWQTRTTTLNYDQQKNGFQLLKKKKKKKQMSFRARTMYHDSHKAFKAIDLRPLDHLDTVVSDDHNMWYCFYYNVSQLMGLRYSPVLKQKLIQTSNSIQSYQYHMIKEASINVLWAWLEIHQFLSTCISSWIRFLRSSDNVHWKVNQEFRL